MKTKVIYLLVLAMLLSMCGAALGEGMITLVPEAVATTEVAPDADQPSVEENGQSEVWVDNSGVSSVGQSQLTVQPQTAEPPQIQPEFSMEAIPQIQPETNSKELPKLQPEIQFEVASREVPGIEPELVLTVTPVPQPETSTDTLPSIQPELSIETSAEGSSDVVPKIESEISLSIQSEASSRELPQIRPEVAIRELLMILSKEADAEGEEADETNTEPDAEGQEPGEVDTESDAEEQEVEETEEIGTEDQGSEEIATDGQETEEADESEDDQPPERVIVETERQVKVNYRLDRQSTDNIVVLDCELIGFDEVPVALQWQVNQGDNCWQDVPGATGEYHEFEWNEDTEAYTWRVAVTLV